MVYYFLSVLESLDSALDIVVGVGFLGIIAYVVGGVIKASEESAFLQRIGRIAAITGMVALGVDALVPTQERLLRAYLMVHGAEALESNNSKRAVEDFTERVDAIVTAVQASNRALEGKTY